MASGVGAISRASYLHPRSPAQPVDSTVKLRVSLLKTKTRLCVRIRANSDGNSYLDMWRKAVDRERKEIEFQSIANNSASESVDENGNDFNEIELEKKSEEFQKILEVSKEERDRVQRMQVIDRAAAAIAAARAVIQEDIASVKENTEGERSETMGPQDPGTWNRSVYVPRVETSGSGIPGPDFWSWTPPPDGDRNLDASSEQTSRNFSVPLTSTNPVMEKDQYFDPLSIPFESKLLESNHNPPLPPFQSLMEVEKVEVQELASEKPSRKEGHEIGELFSAHAAEAAHALEMVDESSSYEENPDGSKWWKETGIEQRPDGLTCRWTMTRGVSADQVVEWQEKFWEAADEFDYKELGSEKSGRDANGNVWREFWRETMWQDCGLMHIEKTADKWGKNGNGDEWQEKWWEHYDASGKAEKWAHKWCSIDPTTHLNPGHAHVWHERWGEKYDGHGGSMKYTDKWAERCEGDSWTKWGDKWDENFDPDCHGVKQGETWWEGKYGERWNRTWGEQHNGSGWVHKYGKSSSGEHWDTHVEQETWYERFPHFGFYHCFDNSVQLREVRKPSEME
ncbi:uncharacterized protein LOC120015703 isoform X2 [Tripterygium wilfordii]|uniref:uncharacterized protein LOC120015703 isoform X2 n=1 Tax=Tripterygium wilfordii TaxID=458696 RepID=UPI0018F85ABF|nr:uncharacterized protein LOC120015703 isoform X2 [Tripterygium wilfordii]